MHTVSSTAIGIEEERDLIHRRLSGLAAAVLEAAILGNVLTFNFRLKDYVQKIRGT